jgi:hypothetical protein
MKTAIGRAYERKIARAPAELVAEFARDAMLELGDLLDHSGPRALRNRAAHDMRLFRMIREAAEPTPPRVTNRKEDSSAA